MLWLTLIALFDTENGELFVQMYDRHHDRLFQYAYDILGHKEDTEDAMQDTWRKVYRWIDLFRKLTEDERVALLRKFTRNTAIDFFRKRKRNSRVVSLYTIDDDGDEAALEIPDSDPQPEEILINRETQAKIAACIEALPDSLRDIVEMKYRFYMRSAEIADVMGISENAVNLRIMRAKTELRKMMEEEAR